MAQRLIDPDAVIAPLKEEYKKVKQAFDETSVFQAPNDVALYGALMQELGAVIGMIEDEPAIDAVPVEYIEEFIEKHKRVAVGYNLCSSDSANRCWVMKEFLEEWRREHDKTN